MSTFVVNSSTGLLSALKTVHSGDTILLASGSYAATTILNVHIAGNVTVTSQNLANPALHPVQLAWIDQQVPLDRKSVV